MSVRTDSIFSAERVGDTFGYLAGFCFGDTVAWIGGFDMDLGIFFCQYPIRF
jgi:hypothetical protein